MVGRGFHRLVGLLSVLLLPAASFGVEVSVCRDATYDLPSSRGIVCSGSGATPAGNACPRKGDRASKDCRSGLPSFAGSTCLAKEDATCSRVAGGVWGCVFPSSGCAGLATATAKMTCPSWEDTSEDGYYTEGLVEIGSGRRLQALEETDVPDSWFEMETEPTEIGACDDPPTRSPTPSPVTSRPSTTSTPIPSVNPSSTPVTAAPTPTTPQVPTSSMPATGTAPTPSPSSNDTEPLPPVVIIDPTPVPSPSSNDTEPLPPVVIIDPTPVPSPSSNDTEPLPPVVIIDPTPVPSPSSNDTEPLPPVVIIDPTPVPSPTPIVTPTLPPCSSLEPIDLSPGDDSNTTTPHPPTVTPSPGVSEQPIATPAPTPSITATLPPCSDLEPIDFPPGDSTGSDNPIALPSPGPGYTEQPTPAPTSTETPGPAGPIVFPPTVKPGSGLTEEPAPVPTNTETPGPVGPIVIPQVVAPGPGLGLTEEPTTLPTPAPTSTGASLPIIITDAPSESPYPTPSATATSTPSPVPTMLIESVSGSSASNLRVTALSAQGTTSGSANTSGESFGALAFGVIGAVGAVLVAVGASIVRHWRSGRRNSIVYDDAVFHRMALTPPASG